MSRITLIIIAVILIIALDENSVIFTVVSLPGLALVPPLDQLCCSPSSGKSN